MLFRKSVVLSVLAAFAVASHSVFADVALSPRGGENRRQLKKRGKKSRVGVGPTQPAFTRSTIELRLYVATAGGYQIFKADDVNKENELNEFSITTTFETTTGIEQTSCDVTLCLTVPLIGGCVFLRSGGQYLFNPFPPANETVSPLMTAASIGGTGIGFFGQQAFVSFNPTNNGVEINGYVIYKFEFTIIESVRQTENNKLYAEEVPGFVPAEALGEFYGEEYSSTYTVGDYIESLFN